MEYFGNRKVVAQFVNDILRNSDIALPWITIMPREKSEDFFVSIVTDTSSEDIVRTLARIYSVALLNISPPNTQDG